MEETKVGSVLGISCVLCHLLYLHEAMVAGFMFCLPSSPIKMVDFVTFFRHTCLKSSSLIQHSATQLTKTCNYMYLIHVDCSPH